VRRLLLVSNTNAHRVTAYGRDVIARALAAEFKLDEVQTARPGDAIDLAREAALDGIDVVAALGGDGTVNEVANGLVGSDAALAIVPAGMANVFARSLGIPADPVEATGWLLEHARDAPRQVSLGRAGDRYFLVSCGVGFDAAIVREVERRQLLKRRAGDWFFVWTGLRVFFRGYDRRRPHLSLSWGPAEDEHRDGLFLAIVQNTSPYTFLRSRALRLCPDAELEAGLDCMALDSLKTRVALRVVGSAFRSGRHERFRHVTYVPDRRRFEVSSQPPLPVQVDGEYIGEHELLVIESAPSVLNVLY